MQEQHINLAVDGMSCGGCVRAVENVIRDVPGVTEVKVDLDAARAEVAGSGFDIPQVIEAVRDAGFEARQV